VASSLEFGVYISVTDSIERNIESITEPISPIVIQRRQPASAPHFQISSKFTPFFEHKARRRISDNHPNVKRAPLIGGHFCLPNKVIPLWPLPSTPTLNITAVIRAPLPEARFHGFALFTEFPCSPSQDQIRVSKLHSKYTSLYRNTL